MHNRFIPYEESLCLSYFQEPTHIYAYITYRSLMHPDTEKAIEKAIDTRIVSLKLEEQREVAKRYNDEAIAQDKKPRTRLARIYALRKLTEFTEKPFEDVSKDDLIAFSKHLSEKHSKNTKFTIEAQVKHFYKWLEGDDEEYPKKVRWMKVKKDGNHLTHEDILTHQEIRDLVKACDHLRDRAMLMVLWESGARASELLRMKVGSVHRDKFGTFVTLKGKTGIREVRLIKSEPYLKLWLNHHPFLDDKKSPLWIWRKPRHDQYEGIGAGRLRVVVYRARDRAKLQKKVWPHLFRHTRLTELAKRYTEAELRLIAGWETDSKMPGVYVHLSGRDIKERMAVREGLKEEEAEEEISPLKPWICVLCNSENPATHIICWHCGETPDRSELLISSLEGRIDKQVEEKTFQNMMKVMATLKERGYLDRD